MINALTYKEMLGKISENEKYRGINDDTIGILITRPDLDTGENILRSLEYYHHLTGKNINFFLPGYGAYWNSEYPDKKEVTVLDGVKWYFSNEMFVRFIDEMESNSKWEYSGESELLLLKYNDKKLSYNEMLRFYLDNMLRDKVIDSIPSFFQQLFRVLGKSVGTRSISGKLMGRKAVQIVKEYIFDKLPWDLGEVIKQERYFCMLDCEK